MSESYEELRNIVVEFIVRPIKPGGQARQWNDLVRGVERH